MLRADSPGEYTVLLSNGETRTVRVPSVPAAADLSGGWSLELESWGPHPTSTDPTVPLKTIVTFPGNALGLWSGLPATSEQLAALGVTGMNQVSGIGRYKNTIELPASWRKHADGGYLVFGHGNGDMVVAVTINGIRIETINQVTRSVDIGPYLRAGPNSVEVEINTNLGNRVGRGTQNYGLTSVGFQPYTDTGVTGGS
jgi:hypothetical protein